MPRGPFHPTSEAGYIQSTLLIYAHIIENNGKRNKNGMVSFDGGEKETMTATIYGFISSIYVSARKIQAGAE